ncbi:hypothetical protein MBRA_02610 [Methylobacterium brachiatum]|jgi:hypothetical protein|nr:hypothetical protein MBRA_02610 [Methylobacterium brachiatum]
MGVADRLDLVLTHALRDNPEATLLAILAVPLRAELVLIQTYAAHSMRRCRSPDSVNKPAFEAGLTQLGKIEWLSHLSI